jgi:hypothetical protein
VTPHKNPPPRLDELPDLLTVEEYARWARRGRNRAYDDVRLGLVASVRLGRTVRIPKTALLRFLETAGVPPPDTSAVDDPLPLRRRAAP